MTLQPKPDVKDREYMTSDLNLWPAPQEKGKPLDVLDAGGKVAVTGVVSATASRRSCYDGQVRWVNADYLSDEEAGRGADPADRRPAAPPPASPPRPARTAPAPSRG